MTGDAPGAASSVTFCFPYREVSGVPVLFLRMARHLGRTGWRTRVVDYADGYMARTLRPDEPVGLATFVDGVPLHIGPDTVLVMQAVLPYAMRPELVVDPRTRVVFWALYPFNLQQTIIPLDVFRDLQARHLWFHRAASRTLMAPLTRRLRGCVQEMAKQRSILFMDGTNWRTTCERLEADVADPIFVPVACDLVPENRKLARAPVCGRPPTFGWLGRLSDFKVHILVHTLRRLSDYSRRNGVPLTMHVIGEGPLAGLIDRAGVEHDRFRIVRAGTITGAALDDYLVEHVDVLAAMGASALEGAKLGVPTLLLDVSYGPVTGDYKFKWIFEAESYSLGEVMNAHSYERGNDTFERAMRSARDDYARLSVRTHAYCVDNHAIPSVAARFSSALMEAEFTYGDFQPEVLHKGPVRRVYEAVRAAYRVLP